MNILRGPRHNIVPRCLLLPLIILHVQQLIVTTIVTEAYNCFSLFYFFLNRQFSERLNFSLDLSLVFVDELFNILPCDHVLFIYYSEILSGSSHHPHWSQKYVDRSQYASQPHEGHSIQSGYCSIIYDIYSLKAISVLHNCLVYY